MMFTIATNSDALHEESGHGPITARTKEGLKDAMDAARRSGLSFTVRGEFELDSLPFTPMAIRTHNPAALLVRQEGVAAIGAAFLADALVGFVDFGDTGQFQVFDLDAVEAKLLMLVDFADSRFRFSKGVTNFDKTGPRFVGDGVSALSWSDLEERRPGPAVLRVAMVERLSLNRHWAARFFSFDGVLYVDPGIVTSDFGLSLGNHSCEVAAPNA